MLSNNRMSDSNLSASKLLNDDVHPKYGEANDVFYPRCEYNTRFVGTSAFEMSNENYWGTYFRSTFRGGNCDRIAKHLPIEKTSKNNRTHAVESASKVGAFHSPFQIDDYKQIFDKKLENESTDDDSTNMISFCIYDELLNYKCEMCDVVVKAFRKKENDKILVYLGNDYPCIMVQVKKFQDIKTEQSSLYKIAIAYLTAITNHIAFQEKIPIELVIRSSFGHNIPTVAETATSFRINIGIIPENYARKVLAAGLEQFNNMFPMFMESKLKFEHTKLHEINETINFYNKKKKGKSKRSIGVNIWNEEDTVFEFLCKVGDSSGRKLSYQIMRKRRYVDLLCNYVHQELFKQEGNGIERFVAPLRMILTKLNYMDEKDDFKVRLNVDKDEYKFSKISFDETDETKNDNKFWRTIGQIAIIFQRNNIRSQGIGRQTQWLNKEVLGLYSQLEELNLQFIRNSSDLKSVYEFGSDSECEISIEERNYKKYFSKKYTVSTGMRAINLAKFLVTCLTKVKKINTEFMYYETEKSIKNTFDIVSKLNLERVDEEEQEIVRYIDLNHCCALSADSIVNLENIKNDIINESKSIGRKKEKIIVFDCTSATGNKISETVKLFVPIVEVILLVSSGIKNEQIGADINPYGTIRIIAESRTKLSTLSHILKSAITGAEQSPKQVHDIRRAYKSVGAVLNSELIFTKKRQWIHKKTNSDSVSSSNFEIGADYEDYYTKAFNICFSGKYENELEYIVSFHEQYIDEVIHWDEETIQFLGSEDVHTVVTSGANFEDMQYLFERNRDSIKDLITFYRDEICELIDTYECDINDIIDWDDDMIEFLSSERVGSIVRNGTDFDVIKSEYENNPDLIKEIIDDVDSSNEDLFEIHDFDEICKIYESVSNDSDPFGSSENILNKIKDSDVMDWYKRFR